MFLPCSLIYVLKHQFKADHNNHGNCNSCLAVLANLPDGNFCQLLISHYLIPTIHQHTYHVKIGDTK